MKNYYRGTLIKCPQCRTLHIINIDEIPTSQLMLQIVCALKFQKRKHLPEKFMSSYEYPRPPKHSFKEMRSKKTKTTADQKLPNEEKKSPE